MASRVDFDKATANGSYDVPAKIGENEPMRGGRCRAGLSLCSECGDFPPDGQKGDDSGAGRRMT